MAERAAQRPDAASAKDVGFKQVEMVTPAAVGSEPKQAAVLGALAAGKPHTSQQPLSASQVQEYVSDGVCVSVVSRCV